MIKNKMIYEELKNYTDTDYYPFHMPGHKRRLYPFDVSYSIDITEIEGFDDYHHPEGIIRDAMERAAAVYGADASYYLVNGSTGGILSAISAAVELGGEILVARNCHKSVYHTIFMRNLKPHYIYPQVIEELGIAGGILPRDVDNILRENTGIRAVVIVSPTYEGIISDVEEIARVCHQYGAALIVDEAHGAHLPFWKEGPSSAVECGADVVIQSLHKTLPSLTQTAILHWNSGYVDQKMLQRYLHIYQSSSPSYLFLAAIQSCIAYMEEQGEQQMERHGRRMEEFLEACKELQTICVLDRDTMERYGRQAGVFAFDWTRIVMVTTGHRGAALSYLLREKYHLQMEMNTPDYVVAITSLADAQEGIERLFTALREIDREWAKENCGSVEHGKNRTILSKMFCPDIEVYMTPYEASGMKKTARKVEEIAGEVSAETAYIYPPGIPFLVPGEVISREHAEVLLYYKEQGVQIKGIEDPSMNQLQVIERLER